MDLLIVNNLTKVFKLQKKWLSIKEDNSQKIIAIDDISFSLKQAEIVGLTGINGAGKSTLMHLLIGILTPSSGSIKYFGKDFAKNRSAILQDISFASSYFKLAGSLTVLQNFKFFTQIYNMPNKLSDKKIDDLLLKFDLADFKHKRIADLSAGESNKINILKAFLIDAKIVLLDEPTAFLDVKAIEIIRGLIKDQRNKIGTTFFLTSHNQQDISELCDRELKLDKGQLSQT